MTAQLTMGALIGGIGLFERAVGYTLGSLQLVTPASLPQPTPCAGWDLRALLAHMNDSLLALHEAISLGYVGLDPEDAYDDYGDAEADPVATLKNRACRLLGDWSAAGARAEPPGTVAIADLSLSAGIVSGTGAIEVAVHGWDVARACGQDRPIPSGLAEELLPLAVLFVGSDDRPARFAARVEVPRGRPLGDQLLAFLGRDPR